MADRLPGLTYPAVLKGLELLLAEDSVIVPNIVGHGGIGKSQLIGDLAARNHYGFYEITCSLLQPGDLTMPIPKEDRVEYYLNPQVQGAIDWANAHPDSKVILFLDEFNRPVAMVQGELMNLVLQRNLMGTPLPDNVVIITAENPSSDTEGFEGTSYATNSRDMAINDRTMRIRMGTNLDSWIESFASQDHPKRPGHTMIHPLVIEFLQAEGRQYFIVVDETRDKNPTPRAYERISNLFYNYEDAGYQIQALNDDDLLAFLIEGIDGSIGEEAGAVMLTFLENHQADYIKPQEVAQTDGYQLDQSLSERLAAMQPIRRKRVVQDLVSFSVAHPELLTDDSFISRFADLFSQVDGDIQYSLVHRLMTDEETEGLEVLREALYQNDQFVDAAYDITMAINANR
ncbi:ATPase [Aerococcus urinaehominis]|uniref:ATPase n=1 Tax=Aerococcus urinaehominis TaxID=128944 RepID=A0A120IAN7_9LACT|nr:ATP-binding protein [Aerococcus urinaehominis]AMB98664.1 ATPase [Aerococcus urinaehominis]SDL97750.1 hypothetical protein SAMN04487985_10370 [Aerococcus urinaehominis]